MVAFGSQVRATAAGGAAAGGSAFAGSGLTKARLVCSEPPDDLVVHFNPGSLTVNKAASVHAGTQAAAPRGTVVQHVNTQPRTLGATLLFDHWSGGGDVAAAVEKLQSWLNPSQASLDRKHPEAPKVELEWTPASAFSGYLTSANATYSLFAPDGTALRCSVVISIQEVTEPPPGAGQAAGTTGAPGPNAATTPNPHAGGNPTSGGVPGRRTRLLRAGETLQAMAYAEYRDPAMWRALALANGLADPLRLRPGLRVEIPPAAHARELLP